MKLSARVTAVFVEKVRLRCTKLECLAILVMWNPTIASVSPWKFYDN